MNNDTIPTRDQIFEFGKAKLVDVIKNPTFTADTYDEHVSNIKSYMRYLKAISNLPTEQPIEQVEAFENIETDNTAHKNEPLMGSFEEKLSFTADTYDEHIGDIESYRLYLNAINNLSTELPIAQIDASENIETDDPSPENKPITGSFEKKLSGGILNNPDVSKNEPLFISELLMRERGLSHGDLIEVTTGINNRVLDVQLIEKREPETYPDMREFKYGIVENVFDAGQTEPLDIKRPFMVKKSVQGDVLPWPYKLTEYEIENLSIETGDILDLAWYENNSKSRKVIWKYKTEQDLPDTIEKKLLNRPVEQDDTPAAPTTPVFTDNQFENKTICLVGMDMYKDKFKKSVEERMGTFIQVDPKDSRKRRESTYDKADIIMLGLQQISHDASNHAIAYAKQEGILYGSFNGHGTGPFILELINILNVNN